MATLLIVASNKQHDAMLVSTRLKRVLAVDRELCLFKTFQNFSKLFKTFQDFSKQHQAFYLITGMPKKITFDFISDLKSEISL